MRAPELLSALSSKGIKVWVEGDRLRYRAPKGALTPDLREQLVNRKEEIVALLRRADTITSSAVLPLEPAPRDRPLALSFAQQRLWFLDQLEPNQSAFNLSWAVRLKGDLRLAALKQALRAIVDRHEVLRTTYAAAEDGEPGQVVGPAGAVELELAELSDLDPAERDTELRRRMGEQANRPFNLTSGPMLRATLYRLAAEEHVLALVIHHIAYDAWSAGILSRELAAFYAAFVEGNEPDLPAVPIQYADYAAWQRKRLQGEVLEAQIEYWRRQLGPTLPVLDLPTDHPRPAQQSFAGARESHSLSESVLADLQSLSQREGVTLFMTLAAALKVLFHRYSGQSVITIGTPVANRSRSEFEPLIGFFINNLVLSTELEGALSFREALARVREVSLGAYAHQDLPFEQLVEAVRPPRDMSRHPLFQVMFALQNVPSGGMSLPGLQLSGLPAGRTSSQFDLTLYARESAGGLGLVVEYNSDLFEPETIRQLLGHYETLLAGAVAEPEQAISQLPLQSDDERRQLLSLGQGPSAAEAGATTLPGLFEAQVARTPEAVAVAFESEHLSYRELDERSNRLAWHLQTLGVGPGALVGLCLERSAEMLVGLLGVLKAGGAYVPLDPGFPAERLAYMLADADARVLVTEDGLREGLSTHPAEVVSLDGDAARLAAYDAHPVASAAGPEDLAYVIYTSGSTGRPKGVEIPHRAVINFLQSMQHEPGLGADDVLLAVTTLSFDIAVLELFLPLICGAQVVIARRETAVDAEALAALMKSAGVTAMQATPTAWRLLLESGWSGDSQIKAMIGGEAWGWDLAAPLLERCGSVWNMYGPTETTIWSAVRQVQAGDERVSISGPIAETQLYVLDEHLQPAPIGVPGELYIGGAGLARGYWNRPELTAERFIPDPFDPDGRLYRTGDQVRYRSDGSLEFMGRLDHQVKLRGYRIELGEIEAVLATYPGVKQAVVLVREDVPGDQRLVAYMMAESEPDSSELRALARSRLPEYMVPSAWVTLESFPLTPNRKVDRKALPAPEGSAVESGTGYVAPRTPHEEALAGIWAEALGLERVGTRDNFFELGGHSLLATRVIARVRNHFEIELPLRCLFDDPTIESLARVIEGTQHEGMESTAPPLEPQPRDRPLALSFAQQRLWFLDQLEPGSTAYLMPTAVRLRGPLDMPALMQSLNNLVQRHESLRTVFAQEDDDPIQVILPTLELPVPLLDLESLPEAVREAEMQRLRAKEARTPFNLEAGPLMRAQVLRMGGNDHVLLLTMHHIVSDAWSWGILVRELEVLYQACCEGRDPALPPLPVQYADYAVWQRDFLQGQRLEQEVDYWRGYLCAPLPTLQLPVDTPRPSVQTHRGASESLLLSAELKASLLGLSQQSGTTLFMTLLAIFQALVHRWSGQDDVCVGFPSAGRTRVETEGLIGFFINTLTVRTRLDEDSGFLDLLEQVKSGVLGAQAHQMVPFEKLVEVLQPTRDMARTPVFQVLFNMLPAGTGFSLSDLTVEGVGQRKPDAKFDLTLNVREGTAGIQLSVVYNADLFRPERMQAFLAQFRAVAEQVVLESGNALAAYSLVTEDSGPLLPDPGVALQAPRQNVVSDLVAERAADHPERTAITQGRQNWSYGVLVAQASALTRLLQETGVGRGTVVGIVGRPSFGLFASLLGLLRSGGVMVLVDPALPDARKQLMLRQAGARLLLHVGTDEQDVDWIGEAEAPQVIRVTPDTGTVVPGQTIEPLAAGGEPASGLPLDDAAYIFFSSGTTGVPKAIVGSHQGLGHFIAWQRESYGVGPADRVAQLTGLSFDAVLRDVFLPLTSGGVLCLPDEVPEQDGEQVLRWLEREQVTILHTVPTVAEFWLSQAPADVSLDALRWVFLSGEPLTARLVNIWRETFPESGRLVNFYGATETTLIKCYHEIPDAPHPGVQPVEKSLPETQALVLNAEQRLCGVGELGEIVIRTPFRSLGYLTGEGDVSSPFRPNPHCEGEREELYFTGDLGRYRPDGLLDILGRRDDQIKIRGVRIEPPEVMNALVGHPSVQACFVMARHDETGAPALVAYVVPDQDAALTAAELRTWLAGQLPAAMVPGSVVFLEALPYTPNGKIDRQALPAPEAGKGQPEIEYVAPRTPTEERLAQIWQEVLKHNRIGIRDDFFALGGHSLLATRVISRVRNHFGMELQLRCLFEDPTIERLARIVADTQLEDQAPPLEPHSRDRPLSLSFAQQRLWFLDQLEPGSTAYSMPYAFRVRGALDLAALTQSLNELVQRHESLRTVFAQKEEEPIQIILPSLELPVELVDLQSLPESERDTEMQRLREGEAETPFELGAGPLIRAQVLRMGADDHVLLVTMHHIISDAWSWGILLRELGVLYQAFCEGREPILPPLPVQYADYASWQRGYLQGERLEQEVDYWRDYLQAPLPTLRLPTDAPRPSVQTHRGASAGLLLSTELKAGLVELSRQSGTTLFMTLLAIFQSLVHRWSGQDDVCVGFPSAGRTRAETEGLIGFFINTLTVRTRLTADSCFRDLVGQVKSGVLGGQVHQTVPFEKLVEVLQPTRDLARTPVFQVLFNMLPSGDDFSLADLSVEGVGQRERDAKFDLTLYAKEGAAGIRLSLVYSADLFRPERMQAFLQQFVSVAEQVVEDPDRRVSSHSLVTADARALLPDPKQPLESEWAMPAWGRLERHALEQGDAVAIGGSDGNWTYRELETRSNQLAHHLLERGIKAQEVVAIYAARSPELVLALLGVVKAGAAFMVLDPAYPQARLLEMLQIARPGGLVYLDQARPLPDEVSAWATSVPCVGLPAFAAGDPDAGEIWGGAAKSAPSVEVGPDNLAYVTFTSGSTGIPKCLRGTHRPLAHFVKWYAEALKLTAADRVTMFSGLAHDPLLRDVFTPLWAGGAICIPDDETLVSGRAGDWLNEQEVTLMHLTPPLAEVLSVGGDSVKPACTSLRYAVFGGDSLRPVHLDYIKQIAPQARCVNAYGATETPQIMSWYLVPPDFSSEVEQMPIGRGIDGVQMLLLNQAGQPAGVGELAEIYIRTPYLTQGYVNDEILTSARFLPNPFRSEATDRVYRTGDMGRLSPDGLIEFAGRRDFQVKIRGYRIEVGEIETALRQHPALIDAAVVSGGDTPGDRYLVAYLITGEEAELSISDVRGFLERKLPDYMIPSVFVSLDALPRTPAGKVDRKALPAPEGLGLATETEYVAPRTPHEEALAGIWAEVLGLERVGTRDNFFELGGHSLLATRVIARIRDALSVEVPLRALFECPTVGELAQRVAATGQAESGLEPVPLVPVPRDRPLTLSFAQQRLWFLDQLEAVKSAFNLPWTVRLNGRLDEHALEWALRTIGDRHEVLRTTFAAGEDGEPVQVIGASGEIEVERVELASLGEGQRDAELQRQMSERADRPFDLATGPVLRATLYRLAPDDHVLSLTIHHIAVDGWSLGVLAREFGALYAAYVEDREPALPALPIQYADYAAWQRQWLQGEVLDAQLDYWRDQLGSAPAVLELPTDHPRPALQSFRGARESYALSEELLTSLRSLSQREGATLFMTLAAGLKALFQRYSGQSVITIGTPVANRTRSELEPLLGIFINNLVLSTELTGELSFREAVARVRDVSLGAYAHQDLPFEQLVEALSPPRDLSRHPLFQVMFALQNVPREGMKLPDLKLSAVPVQRSSSQFDLTLFAREIGGGLRINVEYNSDLFEPETIRRLLGHYETLLAGAVAEPEQAISRLPLMDASEHVRLLEIGHGPAATDEAPATLSGLFEAQVARTPKAVAVAFESEHLSYRELDQRANRLARHLQTVGVGPGELVGLCLERSAEMVVGLLGVLKAGGAYVPLDPGFPGERLAYMLADAGVRVLVTEETLREGLSAHPAEVVSLDGDMARLAAYDADPFVSPAAAEDLAYVIYTSGSTGRPKGVEIPHRAVINFLTSMKREPGLGAEDVLLAVTTLSFDIAVLEIFLPLTCGAQVVIARRETAVDAEALAALMKSAGVTAMQATPTTWRLLLESGWSGDSQLKAMIGGEAWGWDLAAPLIERCGSVWNMYGPTETTIWSAVRQVQVEDERVSISGPIAETQLYVLDEHLQPAPIGVPGELYIGGAGLARGYWNRPELTAERFVPDPFDPDGRLYRTGDQVRYRADGSLEFMGRLDHQVKLRGYRIELGEIEAVLATYPGVRQAVVLVREDVPGDQRLVAYMMAESEPDSSELRALTRSRLPEYMVPSAWVTLETFPLTPNRKVDRKALPAPEGSAVESGAEFVAPRTPYEEALTEIWAEVLGLEQVGVQDNFFEIGGHSLLALRLRASMEKKFNQEIPLAILFLAPTIEQLAEKLDEGIQPSAWTSLVPMQTEGSNPPFFCVPEAGSTVYSLADLARHLGPNQPFYGLQPMGMDEDLAPHTRIEDMAAHYIKEIKEFQPQGPYMLGGQCFGAEVAFEMAQQLVAQGDEVELLALIGDNRIASWTRKGVSATESAYSLKHALQRTFYYLRRFPLGDVFRTARRELNIRFNPRLQYTRRVFKAQLLARTSYIRKPYPGRVTAFSASASSSRKFASSAMAGLAQGGVEVQRVPPASDLLLREPHVQVVAANLRACIAKAAIRMSDASSRTGGTGLDRGEKEQRATGAADSAVAAGSGALSAGSLATAGGNRPELSLVLPCYNEAPHFRDNMEEVVRALDSAELNYEIIVVDDASTDGTAEQIRSCLSDQPGGNIRALFHDTRRGRGATLAEGIRKARFPYVGFIDINLETPPQFVPAAVDQLRNEAADMVVGNRKTIRGLDAPLQLALSNTYRRLASLLLKTDSLDTASGFKFFRRELILPILDGLHDSHSLWDTELTVLARAKGLRTASLPVSYRRHLTEQSTVQALRDAWRSFASLFAVAKRQRIARQA